MCKKILLLIGFMLVFSACSDKNNALEKGILTPESVEIYDISVDNFLPDRNSRKILLKKFPFISSQPILDFNGKFSNQFYDKIDYRYKYDALKDVDFWKLRNNPFSEDFIYVLPTWVNEFQYVSDNLFENIGYSYNLSSKEQEILKWWIGEGGILWIEGGIYSTRYDTFKKSGEIDTKAIQNKIIKKSSHLHFFNKKVKSYIYESRRIDYINYVPLKINFTTKSKINYFKDIKYLQLETRNFLSADFMPKALTLLESTNNKPLVSFVQYGRGGVVFIRPFDFQNKRYDGELLRWRLLYFLLNKMYITKTKIQANCTISIAKKFDNNQTIVLQELYFAFNSSKVLPRSKPALAQVAKYLLGHKNFSLKIAGYTDNIASQKYNKELSQKRAESVKRELVKMDVNEKRIRTYGHGKQNPVASNETPQGRSLNRRVEFTVLKR